MTAVYTGLALAIISLTFTLRSASHPLVTLSNERHGTAANLPHVQRLDVTPPPLQRTFDATLPNFIEQPTPVLKIIHPTIHPGDKELDGPWLRHPAPATRN